MSEKKQDSLMEEARQNILNYAFDMNILMNMLNTFRSAGYKMFDPSYDPFGYRQQYFDGINQALSAIAAQSGLNMEKLFMFMAVPNEEMIKYAKEQFVKRFGDNHYDVMSFLTHNGGIPHSWLGNTEDKFREELNAAVATCKPKCNCTCNKEKQDGESTEDKTNSSTTEK